MRNTPSDAEYESLCHSARNSQARVVSMERRGEQYMQIPLHIPTDEENDMTTEDEDATFDSHGTSRLRVRVRIGMAVAAVALLVVAVKVTQWSTQHDIKQGRVQDGQNKQEIVAKYNPCSPVSALDPCTPAPHLNPCAPVGATQAPAALNPCSPPPPQADVCTGVKGLLNEETKSCCLPACNAFCAAINCNIAPAGEDNCCTHTFTLLCGSPGVVAPCILPKTIAGVVQLLVGDAHTFRNSPGALRAVVAALSQLLNVPENDITAAHASGTTGGRRLVDAVNVNYEVRRKPVSNVTAAVVGGKSPLLLPILQEQLTGLGVATTVEAAVLPTPEEMAPVVNASGATTTPLAKKPFATLPVTTTAVTTPAAVTTTPAVATTPAAVTTTPAAVTTTPVAVTTTPAVTAAPAEPEPAEEEEDTTTVKPTTTKATTKTATTAKPATGSLKTGAESGNNDKDKKSKDNKSSSKTNNDNSGDKSGDKSKKKSSTTKDKKGD